MTIEDYQNLYNNLISERDKIMEQILALKNPEEQRFNMLSYQMTSLNASMIREVSGVLEQEGLLLDDSDFNKQVSDILEREDE